MAPWLGARQGRRSATRVGSWGPPPEGLGNAPPRLERQSRGVAATWWAGWDAGQLLRSEDLAPPGGQVLYLPAESYSRPRLRALAPRRPPSSTPCIEQRCTDAEGEGGTAVRAPSPIAWQRSQLLWARLAGPWSSRL